MEELYHPIINQTDMLPHLKFDVPITIFVTTEIPAFADAKIFSKRSIVRSSLLVISSPRAPNPIPTLSYRVC